METHEREIEQARARLTELGRNADDFTFDVDFLPPDPDGGGMFTIQYEVTITNRKTSKALAAMGGIGWDWLGEFEQALQGGALD